MCFHMLFPLSQETTPQQAKQAAKAAAKEATASADKRFQAIAKQFLHSGAPSTMHCQRSWRFTMHHCLGRADKGLPAVGRSHADVKGHSFSLFALFAETPLFMSPSFAIVASDG